MVAGAGSGKTTSLVKALMHIKKSKGELFRSQDRQVACITYTEVARDEIWRDVGEDPLFHVSTIHSFLWTVAKSFQSDIRRWVRSRIEEKIEEAEEKIGKPRTRPATKEKERANIVRYREQLEALGNVRGFRYGTGSDYANGVLGHDDIIKMVPAMLAEKPLLRSLLANRFPFVLVDESQDTLGVVVETLKAVRSDHQERFCLGFFGDPMQMIYTTGIGDIAGGDGFEEITKPENFRCPPKVLKVTNAVRAEGDGLEQVSGRTSWDYDGSARLFVAGLDCDRIETLKKLRGWLATANEDDGWLREEGEEKVKLLVIAHRMAARRLGFPDLFAAFNDDRPPQGLKEGFAEGTAWPILPFLGYLLPLADAAGRGDDFEVFRLVRENAPAMRPDRLRDSAPASLLAGLRNGVAEVCAALSGGGNVTVREVLRTAFDHELLDLDERWRDRSSLLLGRTEADGEDESEEGSSVIEKFLDCHAHQLWGYQRYVQDASVFSTQQGVKGAEFDRVLSVLDDEEGQHRQFSYDKYFNQAEPSDTDRKHQEAGEDSVIDRTRRLFYVSCSRATRDLAILYFTSDPEAARDDIVGRRLFPAEDVHLLQ